MDGTNINENPIETTGEASEWDKFFNAPEETNEPGNDGTETVTEEETGTEPGMDPEGAGTVNSSEGEPATTEPTGNGEGEPSGGDPKSNGGNEPGFTPEQQAAIAAQAQKQIDAFYKRNYEGFISPYTKKPIETEADYHAYMQAFEAEEQQRKLAEMGVDQKTLNEIVGNLPEVQQAKAMIAQQHQTQANTLMKDSFDELMQKYPDCGYKNPREMFDSPEGKAVMELWRDTPRLTLAQAYLLLNEDKIKAQQTAAVKQGVMNQMNGKKHLTQTKAGGNPAAEMPEETRAEMRKWFPKDTDEQLKARWLKNQKYSEK